jgi:hypothetical protein
MHPEESNQKDIFYSDKDKYYTTKHDIVYNYKSFTNFNNINNFYILPETMLLSQVPGVSCLSSYLK